MHYRSTPPVLGEGSVALPTPIVHTVVLSAHPSLYRAFVDVEGHKLK